jgi:hypothetical protein
MSFLTKYADKFKPDDLDPEVKANLENLEKFMEDTLDDAALGRFEVLLKEHTDDLISLVDRFTKHFKDYDVSIGGVWGSFKFVLSLGFEVYQMVDNIFDEIVTPDMNEAQRKKVKVDFAKDLVYFIWRAIGPLDNLKFPFRRLLEKLLVRFLAGIVAGFTMDMIDSWTDQTDEMMVSAIKTGKKGKGMRASAVQQMARPRVMRALK